MPTVASQSEETRERRVAATMVELEGRRARGSDEDIAAIRDATGSDVEEAKRRLGWDDTKPARKRARAASDDADDADE